MKHSNQVILITGGSSGLGFEMAKQLSEMNNKVLICGRNIERLEEAKKRLPTIEIFRCDVSAEAECQKLAEWVRNNHPNCNLLINNAAIVHRGSFYSGNSCVEDAREEIAINLAGPITLCKLFIPIIEQNPHPKIINITTGLIYAPKTDYPYYNATKAGLHAFTMVLRKQLEHTPINVTEVMFPAVDTPWHKGSAPKIAISADKAVGMMMHGLLKNKKEIRVGGAATIYKIARLAPGFAFKLINKLAHN